MEPGIHPAGGAGFSVPLVNYTKAGLSWGYLQMGDSDALEPMNIAARYPMDKDMILESSTEERCKMLIGKTKELSEWIERQL